MCKPETDANSDASVAMKEMSQEKNSDPTNRPKNFWQRIVEDVKYTRKAVAADQKIEKRQRSFLQELLETPKKREEKTKEEGSESKKSSMDQGLVDVSALPSHDRHSQECPTSGAQEQVSSTPSDPQEDTAASPPFALLPSPKQFCPVMLDDPQEETAASPPFALLPSPKQFCPVMLDDIVETQKNLANERKPSNKWKSFVDLFRGQPSPNADEKKEELKQKVNDTKSSDGERNMARNKPPEECTTLVKAEDVEKKRNLLEEILHDFTKGDKKILRAVGRTAFVNLVVALSAFTGGALTSVAGFATGGAITAKRLGDGLREENPKEVAKSLAVYGCATTASITGQAVAGALMITVAGATIPVAAAVAFGVGCASGISAGALSEWGVDNAWQAWSFWLQNRMECKAMVEGGPGDLSSRRLLAHVPMNLLTAGQWRIEVEQEFKHTHVELPEQSK